MRKSVFSVVLAGLLLVTAANADGNTELFQAIRNDNLAFVRHNLSKTQLEARDNRGATPLMHAAAFGSIAAMKLLLDAGA
ncbi:MAG: Ankyrin repeat (3 copies), partial [Bryobacterales bacterium]|nr:Ankyrin repeat (3 copies) [Bryobacterales bacterium]